MRVPARALLLTIGLAPALLGCPSGGTAPEPWPPAGALVKPVALPFPPAPPAPRAAADERCAKACHAGVLEAPPHPALAAPHSKSGATPVGCVPCHGGDAAADDEAAAHGPPGPFELLKGANQGAACAGCHVPGSVPATAPVARGALLFLELGCVACHRAGQLGVFAVGPPLDLVGLRGADYVRTMTRDPATFFPLTKMPAFASRFRDRSEEDAMVAFLLWQRGRAAPPLELVARPCASCHGTTPPSPIPGAAAHRCAYIADRRAELSCARCHAGGVAPSAASCGFVTLHGPACAACHEEPPRAR